MDGDPIKYSTRCINLNTGELVRERIFEAINRNEAKTRAYLNCLNDSCDGDVQCNKNVDLLAKRYNLRIEAERI